MKHTVYIILLFLAFDAFGSKDTLVNDALNMESEIHAAINPYDSNHIVVSAINLADTTRYTPIYYTLDGGKTWIQSTFKGHYVSNGQTGDPVLSFDHKGNINFVDLFIDFTTQNQNAVECLVSKSTDKGATWSLANRLDTLFPDKPWIATNIFKGSKGYGNSYLPVVGDSLFLYTLDSNLLTISKKAIPNGDHTPFVALNKQGDVIVSEVRIFNPTANGQNIIYVHQFNSGGDTIVHSTAVDSFPDFTFNAPGISWRFHPHTSVAMDNSGGLYDGRLYLTYTASEDTSAVFDVFLRYSDDNGKTWSPRKRVHSNSTPSVQQFYSSISINGDGIVVLDWYDRKNYGSASTFTDFFLGVSKDGGNSFVETKLNSQPTDFDSIMKAQGDFGVGDYHQVVSTKNHALSFWADGRKNDGDINLYFAKVSLNSLVGVEEIGTITESVKVSSIYPNPVRNEVFIDITLKDQASVLLAIHTLEGKLISQTPLKQLSNGKHKLSHEISNLGAGIYYFSIRGADGFINTQRFVVE